MRTERSVAFALGVVLLLSPCAFAERLPIRSFTTEDGLPTDEVYRIRSDSQGFLWFLAREGLARFDGLELTTFGPEHGLSAAFVLDFLETRDGRILVATSEGVYSLAEGTDVAIPRFERIPIEESEVPVWAEILYEDSAGRVWCGLADGLYRLEPVGRDLRLRKVDLSPHESPGYYHVNALLEGDDGSLWIGGRDLGGLLRRFPDGRLEIFGTDLGLPRDDVRTLLADSRGTVWLGTSDGLCTLVQDPRPGESLVSRCYGERDGLGSTWVWQVLEDSRGTLWIGTDAGVAASRADSTGQPFRAFGPAHGIPGRNVTGLAEDREGNLWLGTDAGVGRLARDGFATFGPEDGLDSATYAITESREGAVCAITGVGGPTIACFDGERFRSVRPKVPPLDTGWGWGRRQLHLQDRNGQWWVTTFDGLHRFPRLDSLEDLARVRPERSYGVGDGLLDETVFRLFEDSRGDLWIGTAHGENVPQLFRWRRESDTIESVPFEPGVPGDSPLAFAEDPDGTLWVGCDWGLRRQRSGGFELLDEQNGMPVTSVDDLLFDASGRLWATTRQFGVLRFDDPRAEVPRARAYTVEDGLTTNHVLCLAADRFGRIYLGTVQGVDRLEPETGHVRHFSYADGLPVPRIHVAFTDRQGAVWFGTTAGMSRLEPSADRPAGAPPVRILAVRVAGISRGISPFGVRVVSPFEMKPDERQIEIEFSSLSLRTGDRVRFQYRLGGGDDGWSEPTTDRKVNLAGLAPGRYRFELRAIDSEKQVSPEPAVVSFRVLPPFWKRWWFVSLVLAVVAAAAYGAHRVRLRRVVELERVRMRIATDLHDDIGSSLSQISIFSEVASRQIDGEEAQAAKPLLAQIAGTSRELVDSMSDIVWAINPKRDRAVDLVQRMRRFASDTFTGRNIRLRFEAAEGGQDRRLDLELRREIFLVFKEAVNNAAKHSGCSEAEISFRLSGKRLVLEVRDDGRGFDVRRAGDGNGLESMRRRAEAMGGTLDLRSSPGAGTSVCLKIPVRL